MELWRDTHAWTERLDSWLITRVGKAAITRGGSYQFRAFGTPVRGSIEFDQNGVIHTIPKVSLTDIGRGRPRSPALLFGVQSHVQTSIGSQFLRRPDCRTFSGGPNEKELTIIGDFGRTLRPQSFYFPDPFRDLLSKPLFNQIVFG